MEQNKLKEISFEGIPSGDGECFCFKVTADVYRRIAGEERYQFELIHREEWEKEVGFPLVKDPNLFDLYPNDIFGHGEKLKVTMTVETIC